MSDIWYDDKTMGELRNTSLDILIYNYGEDLQVLKEQLAEQRAMLQRWFNDCNRGGSEDFSLWDETEALLKQGGE